MKKLTRDGVALAYNEDGTGDPPMVLVHCWVCDHTFFAPQFDHFSGTQRVITVDLRGHGESDKPQQAYTVTGFAEDLVWLCRQLAVEKPVVVGHSMGGNVALELAASYPDFKSRDARAWRSLLSEKPGWEITELAVAPSLRKRPLRQDRWW